MNARIARAGLRCLTGVLLAGVVWAAGVGLAQTGTDDKKGKEAEKSDPAPKLPDKKIALSMDGKPWNLVFAWLSEQTGKPVIQSSGRPTGTFSFISPPGATYTLPEIIDIINFALLSNSQTQKFYLIHHENAFTLIPADEKIQPELMPQVTVEDLAKRGKTELVKTVFTLKTMNADETAAEVKQMLGPFGGVVPLAKFNQLVVHDTAGNLQRIWKLLKQEDASGEGPTGADFFQHECKFIPAIQAERILKEQLGVPQAALPTPAPTTPGTPGTTPPPGTTSPPSSPWPFTRPPSTPNIPSRSRPVNVSCDEKTNVVFVSGPPDKIALAREIMKQIDVRPPGGQEIPRGLDPILKQYSVPAGDADAIARALKAAYPSPSIQIQPVGNNSVMVLAYPADQFKIARQINGPAETREPRTARIELAGLDVNTVAPLLKTIYGDPKMGAPTIEAEPNTNSIVVRGTADQITDVQQSIKALTTAQALGEGMGAGGIGTRYFTLDKGSGAALADHLRRLMGGRWNVEIMSPDGTLRSSPGQPAQPMQPIPPQRPGRSMPRADERERETGAPDRNGPQDRCGGLDEQQEDRPQAAAQEPPARRGTVRIVAFGNRIIVSSDDPEALRMAQQLIRLITQTPVGEGDFEVIPLRFANAEMVAKVLDETFNGPRQQAQQGGGRGGRGGFGGGGFGGFGGFGQQAAAAAGQPQENRIRVVADTGTNSLIVKANPLDMISIRRLLEHVDASNEGSKAVLKSWMIPLKHAAVHDVAQTVRDLFREYTNNNLTAQQLAEIPGGFSRIFAANNRNVDTQGNPRSVQLSIGVDDRSNTLMLYCSEKLYQEIKALAEELDAKAHDAARTVKIVPVRGVDPYLIQQMIDALQGRPTTAALGGRGGVGSSFPGAVMTPGGSSGFMPSGSGGFGGSRFGGGGGFSGGSGFGGSRGSGFGGSRGSGFGGSRGGGRSSSNGPRSQGPDFFAERVTDDPQQQPVSFFDPHRDSLPLPDDILTAPHTPADGKAGRGESAENSGAIQPIVYQAPGVAIEGGPGGVQAPRSTVTATPLQQLGVVVVSGNNPADVELVIELIRRLQEIGAVGNVELRLVPMRYADATATATVLTGLFRQIVIGPSGTSLSAVPQRTTVQEGPNARVETFEGALASVVLVPVARLNAIFVAAPIVRMNEILARVKELDQPNAGGSTAVPFPLKRAPAAKVATLINGFWAARFPGEGVLQHQIRVTTDDRTNTVYIQAAPADLAEIRELINRLDNSEPGAVYDVRYVRLKFAVAQEMAAVLLQSISEAVSPTSGTLTIPGQTTVPGGGLGAAGGGFGAAGGGFGAAGGGFGAAGGAGGGFGAAGGAGGGFGAAGAAGGFGAAGASGFGAAGGRLGGAGALGGAGGVGGVGGTGGGTSSHNKAVSLRLATPGRSGLDVVQSGLLEDIQITPDARTNGLLLAAPEKTMELLLKLIDQLDIPAGQAVVNVFPLKRANAGVAAALLQQLFLGGGAGRTGAAAGAPGAPAAGGAPGGALGVGAAATSTGFTVSGASGRLTTGIGFPQEGIPLIDLRVTVDERTNTIIAAGSRSDLQVIEAILYRLEDSEVEQRHNEIYHLRNIPAVDAANAVNSLIQQNLSIISRGQQLTAFAELTRDVVIVPEPITNKLLISATPRYFADVLKLLSNLDAEPPQVAIQVLIAEVDLSGQEEFGVELGFQSPVVFQRSVIPNQAFLGTGTISYASSTTPGALVPTGVTVTGTQNPVAQPGFSFNNVTVPLGNNPVVQPWVVGYQGLGNLGVGRVSPVSGVGGFVFSAVSDSVNILIRALKRQGRVDILSRPQVITLDNQAARVFVGQNFPIVLGSNVTATGVISNNITYQPVGVELLVTPRITPDGRVIMRVTPGVSSTAPTNVSLGNGITATAINQQVVDTTVIAQDGETVALGGLITKNDQKQENKIPWLGDLPVVGAAFRYRTQYKTKQELLIIMTPHIVRCRAEADRILAEEASKMDMLMGDMEKWMGNPIPKLPPPPPPGGVDGNLPGALPGTLPGTLPPPLPVTPGDQLPAPRPTAPGQPATPPAPSPGQPGTPPPPAPGPTPNLPMTSQPRPVQQAPTQPPDPRGGPPGASPGQTYPVVRESLPGGTARPATPQQGQPGAPPAPMNQFPAMLPGAVQALPNPNQAPPVVNTSGPQ